MQRQHIEISLLCTDVGQKRDKLIAHLNRVIPAPVPENMHSAYFDCTVLNMPATESFIIIILHFIPPDPPPLQKHWWSRQKINKVDF